VLRIGITSLFFISSALARDVMAMVVRAKADSAMTFMIIPFNDVVCEQKNCSCIQEDCRGSANAGRKRIVLNQSETDVKNVTLRLFFGIMVLEPKGAKMGDGEFLM
jgi:hypothetical protein